MDAANFASESGLRPMSAFVVIGAVLGTVAGWVPVLAQHRQAKQPDRIVREVGEAPAFAIVDRKGRTIARSVPRFDLEMSPRSMWQAHTPEYMAACISEILGGDPPPAELLERMLPDAVDGWIEIREWELDARRAHRLLEWVGGGAQGERAPLPGIHVVQSEQGGRSADDPASFRVFWSPVLLLSAELREDCGISGAAAWGRYIADGFVDALRAPDQAPPRTADDYALLRRDVWRALIPSAHAKPICGLPQERALALRELLEDESVSPWQMELAYATERTHPCGEHELVGSWGFPDRQATEPEPRDGLELAARNLLAEVDFGLEFEPEVYRWSRDSNVRGDRAHHFVDFRASSQPVEVRSTLDLGLQAFTGEILAELLETNRAAVAMAVVVDVESGDVLAVDAAEGYPIAPFAPIYHAFTPGSTFKLVTVAVALEEGVIQPTTMFDVGPVDHYLLEVERPLKSGGTRHLRRTIHEAEGSRGGVLSAAECLAWSVNAGLAQIGLRLSDDVFRERLVRLGYGSAPGSGLGVEKQGSLASLPWTRIYTQASISFGHELTTTIWQHASALTTVIRGGVLRPLRLFTAVEQNGSVQPIEVPSGERLFSERTCSEVRAMMRLGAAEGTGSQVVERMLDDPRWRDAARALEGVDLATKTGTAQKVASELCLHVELEARTRWADRGVTPTSARLRALKGVEKPHRSCYTSSMCVFARSPVDGRELMVLVVVDEPRGREKFGSKVAGPAAFALLAEASGLTRDGELPLATLAGGFFFEEAPLGVAEEGP